MKTRIYQIIEIAEGDDRASAIYDRTMIALILLSMVPLFFKGSNPAFRLIDKGTAAVFVVDYLLRWWTADRKLGRGLLSHLIYPFTPFAIIDLLSILPAFAPVSAGFKLLRLLRLAKAFRALRMLRYSRSFALILDVIRRERTALLAVCWLAGGYVVLSALIMFQAEPDTFGSFFDAFYWAMVTLTTVGYGDVYPVTAVGRIVSMISSFMGIAIVALPTGIITAGYMSALAERTEGGE